MVEKGPTPPLKCQVSKVVGGEVRAAIIVKGRDDEMKVESALKKVLESGSRVRKECHRHRDKIIPKTIPRLIEPPNVTDRNSGDVLTNFPADVSKDLLPASKVLASYKFLLKPEIYHRRSS